MTSFRGVAFGLLASIFLWCSLFPTSLLGQCANCKKTSYSLVIKGDATALLRNEYRLTVEKTFWDWINWSWHLSGGSFQYTNQLGVDESLAEARNLSEAFGSTFSSNRKSAQLNTLGFFDSQDTELTEQINGLVFRVGLRQYLTHISPYGLFIQITGSYTGFQSRYVNASQEVFQQADSRAFGGGLGLGYQFLMGGRGQFAIDIFGGVEYMQLRRNYREGGNPFSQTAPFMISHAGVQLGWAFHK